MLEGKIKYVRQIIESYVNWQYILFCRLISKPIKKIKLRDDIYIVGNDKSLAIDIVDEIFIRKVYNPSFLGIKRGDTVVDIGANIGIFSLYAALNGASSVYSIEPLKENLNVLVSNFKNNNIKIPVIINAAISDKNGSSKLYVSEFDSHNLLFNKNNNQKFTKYRLVKTFTLSSFLKKYGIDKIDFLKIDCEGSEGYIFASTGSHVWKVVDKIAIEYHNGVSILNSKEILAKLIKLGYKTSMVENDTLFGYIYAWR